jgi:hypothetical protein
MARRVFFSFHYQNDIWRVSQIRNSWVTAPDRETAGFWDAASWEKVKQGGDAGIKAWIENQLDGTSVTVVLIGSQTAERKYVQHEIIRSHDLGKGLLGVWIHSMKGSDGYASPQGANPFANVFVQNQWGQRTYFTQLYPTYDYVGDDGRSSLASWIESAAKAAGR